MSDRAAVPDLAWWYQDPALWELLEFEAGHDEGGVPLDLRWRERERVLEAMVLAADGVPGESGEFARYLLRQETSAHGHSWGFRHGIELAALLVARERRVEDVWLLWAAVVRSFDTYCGLPHEVLFAGGVERTRSYVEESDHPQRENLGGQLRAREVTDASVAEVLAGREAYYRKVLAEPAG